MSQPRRLPIKLLGSLDSDGASIEQHADREQPETVVNNRVDQKKKQEESDPKNNNPSTENNGKQPKQGPNKTKTFERRSDNLRNQPAKQLLKARLRTFIEAKKIGRGKGSHQTKNDEIKAKVEDMRKLQVENFLNSLNSSMYKNASEKVENRTVNKVKVPKKKKKKNKNDE